MDGWVEIGSFWKLQRLSRLQNAGGGKFQLEQNGQLCENTGKCKWEWKHWKNEFVVPAVEAR